MSKHENILIALKAALDKQIFSFSELVSARKSDDLAASVNAQRLAQFGSEKQVTKALKELRKE